MLAPFFHCLAAAFSATCADAGVFNGSVTLYWHGNQSRPWDATCVSSVEYLVIDPTVNWYKYGCQSTPPFLETHFRAVRLDVSTGTIDATKYVEISSSGDPCLRGDNTNQAHLNWGYTGDCIAQYSSTGQMRIDVSSTPFRFITSAVKWCEYFFAQGGDINLFLITDSYASVTGYGGDCGEIHLGASADCSPSIQLLYSGISVF